MMLNSTTSSATGSIILCPKCASTCTVVDGSIICHYCTSPGTMNDGQKPAKPPRKKKASKDPRRLVICGNHACLKLNPFRNMRPHPSYRRHVCQPCLRFFRIHQRDRSESNIRNTMSYAQRLEVAKAHYIEEENRRLHNRSDITAMGTMIVTNQMPRFDQPIPRRETITTNPPNTENVAETVPIGDVYQNYLILYANSLLLASCFPPLATIP